jgi:hypothetical protein
LTRKKDKRPAPIVTLDRGRISPVSVWDAELIDDMPNGSQFDLVLRTKRSTPHNAKYWACLSQIVKATDAWPSAEKMHEWVKVKLGYVSPIFGPKGDVIGMTVDSTAFAQMDQAGFNAFYERFAALVADEMGIDIEDMG